MTFRFGIFILLIVLPVVLSRIVLRWNPRFKNPWTDPDFNDFDKNTWQIAVHEYSHNIIALQVINDTNDEILDYTGFVNVQAISHLYAVTKNESYNTQAWYDGALCMHDIPVANYYMIAALDHPFWLNCVGYRNNQTVWYYGASNGHMFIKDYSFNRDLAPDKRYLQIHFGWKDKGRDQISFETPNVPLLSEDYRPHRIELEQPLPSSVVANNPFQVQLKMVNNNGSVISSSLNSGLEIMIQVSFIHKWFERKGGLWLAQTDVVLGGPNVITSVTNDQVIFTNFVKGRANVTLQLEDIHDGVELNFTSKFHVHNYRRYPDLEYLPEKDVELGFYYFQKYGNHLTDPCSNATHIKYQHFQNDPNYFRGVKIANVTVTAQTPHSLRIVPDSKAKLKHVQKIYRPFKPPLLVEILDVNGNRVTSGPDSILEVTVFSDVLGTIFSSDASFNLHRGVGTFMGSIIKVIRSTHVGFSVESSVGKLISNNTNNFDVQDGIHIGSQPSLEEFNAFGATIKSFTDGPLNGIGKFHTYPHSENANIMLDWFDREKAMEFVAGTTTLEIVAIVGPRSVEDTGIYAGIAGAYDIPIYNYKSTESKYSDKSKYPNFVRLTYSNQYQYFLVCNFLASRKWNNLLVVTTIETPIPHEFIFCSSIFNIQYTQVTFPAALDNTADIPDDLIQEFFDEVCETRLMTVLSFVSGSAINYMVAEVTKRRFTRENGYLWIGTDDLYNYFPYGNEGRCQGLTNLTCVEAFKGTIILQPYYPMHGFKSKNWAMFKSLYTDYVFWKHSYQANNEAFPTDPELLQQIALAYDAMQVFAHTWADLGKITQTLTLRRLLDHVPMVKVDFPLSGESVLFDKNFDRQNYTAVLLQIDGDIGATGKSQVLKKKRLIALGEDVTPYNINVNNALTEISLTGQTLLYRDVPDAERNTLSIKTISGSFNEVDELGGTMDKILITEKVPPAFHCTGGCGGNRSHPDNQHIWDNGICVKHETCACNIDATTGNPGYTGKNCENAVCIGCVFGKCVQPRNCVCDAKYKHSANNTDCAIPTCITYGCNENFGECTSADFCKCKPDYYGKDCMLKCNCAYGTCSDGESGNGQCTCVANYTGSTCSTHLAVIMVPTILGILLVLVILFLIGKKKYKQLESQAALMNTEWIADWENIRLRQHRAKSSVKSLTAMISMMSAKSVGDGEYNEKIISHNQATWNGRDVVLKMLRKGEEKVELNEDLRLEMKEMRDIKHPNLCLFVGACIRGNHICILNEVCGKGSLEGILLNDQIEIGWDFRYSMMKDICRGMQYLHTTDIGSHGRLKSSNCLVDNRWTVKLSDYGLKNFKSDQDGVRIFSPEDNLGVKLPKKREMDKCDYKNLLWTAPEIIATGVSHPDHVGYGTQKGDVYSFGIILVEMCTREQPYHEIEHLNSAKIVQMVGRRRSFEKSLKLVQSRDSENIPINVLRPKINEDEFPRDADQAKGLNLLIRKCWNQDPLVRPEFGECMKMLGRVSPHNGELMDNLIALMEQYTLSLEDIVAERTSDVVAEKEKGDLLLSKMLPPLIGEELKLGKNPTPEFFNCVTIYFSDCVGFGKICADATPYEVVGLLNDLYSVMDDVMESFDCYKVETIGDCYVVASGLPIRNGDNHAGEIASMALQLMTTINGVSYKHIPGSQVQLRVGINSGSIVAGVVGLRMPRYCLFGDTMNTASRMESGGYALKIHMSEETYKILDRLGGYQFECRGERQVKGRGLMKTYWLLGKDDSHYELPPEYLALSASQHNFK